MGVFRSRAGSCVVVAIHVAVNHPVASTLSDAVTAAAS